MTKGNVNVSELRSGLSACLARVRNGEEILIRDRNLPIARLVPLSSAEDFEEGLLELAAQGLVRLPRKRLDLKGLFAAPAPEIPMAALRAAIEAEREED
jgi:prevent-host-death family protein